MEISEKVAYLKGLAEGLNLDVEKSKEGKLISVMIGILEEVGLSIEDLEENALALGEEAARQCMVSSTKSMTGHMLGAAGAVEAIACVLAVKEGIVPPTIGYEVPDPECDLDYVPNQAREAQVDLALSASLGFGGHNAYLAFRRV